MADQIVNNADWKSMSSAPKDNPLIPGVSIDGQKILAVNEYGEQAVVYWTTQYPVTDGAWVTGWQSIADEEDVEGIGCGLYFYPVAWDYLPQNKPDKKIIAESKSFLQKERSKLKYQGKYSF